MFLTNENVYYYLIERNLINNKSVIEGDYLVQPLTTRNNILKVYTNTGTPLFIKQAAQDESSIRILQREAGTYKFFKNNNTLFSTLSTKLPAFLDYDADRNILVTELKVNTTSLHEYYMLTKRFAPELAAEQAAVLSAFHIALPDTTNLSFLPKTLPWAFIINDHDPYKVFPGNKMNGEIISLIQNNSALKNAILQLKDEWQVTTFIHGDIKWTNFLKSNKPNETSLSLIDWELADIGDPLWDVAGLLQSYISAWVFSFNNATPHQYTLNQDMQAFDIQQMQPSLQALLSTYFRLQNIAGDNLKKAAIKTIKFTAARIIQTSIEGVMFDPQIQANNIRCIQLASNILKDPENAFRQIVGIKL